MERITYHDNGKHLGGSLAIWAMLAENDGDGLGHTNGALADDNQGQQAHALNQVGLLEAQHTPNDGHGENGNHFQTHGNVPNQVDVRVIIAIVLERQGHGSEHSGCDEIPERVQTQRNQELIKPSLHAKEENDQVLDGQDSTTDGEQHAQDTEVGIVIILCIATGLELRTDESETNVDDQLDGLAGTLVNTVDGEADIVEGDGEPGAPEQTEEF